MLVVGPSSHVNKCFDFLSFYLFMMLFVVVFVLVRIFVLVLVYSRVLFLVIVGYCVTRLKFLAGTIAAVYSLCNASSNFY